MRKIIQPYSVELKYSIITLILIGMLVLLDRTDAFRGLDGVVNEFFDVMTRLGFLGMFIVALIGNSSLVIQVPYTVPLFSVALEGSTLENLLLLGLGAGIGAGFGEIISYGIADKILERNPDLSKSQLYQWVEKNVRTRPSLIPWMVFIWAAAPLPDDSIIVPLAMVKYGIKKISIPMFVGKLTHNVGLAIILYFASEQASNFVSAEVKTDLALSILIVFIMVILYQVEKTKSS